MSFLSLCTSFIETRSQFTDSASLGDQQAPGMHMIPPPWDHRCSLLTFMCVLGIQMRVLVLVEKALPQKSPFSAL